MSAAVVTTVQCHFCSKWRLPFRTHQLESRQVICDDCLDGHLDALVLLGGGIPKGCYQCGASWELLTARTPGTRIHMYVAPKDGILQVLCARCVNEYTPKRADLYKGTEFGRNELKL